MIVFMDKDLLEFACLRTEDVDDGDLVAIERPATCWNLGRNGACCYAVDDSYDCRNCSHYLDSRKFPPGEVILG